MVATAYVQDAEIDFHGRRCFHEKYSPPGVSRLLPQVGGVWYGGCNSQSASCVSDWYRVDYIVQSEAKRRRRFRCTSYTIVQSAVYLYLKTETGDEPLDTLTDFSSYIRREMNTEG